MGLKKILGLEKWEPDRTREPPTKKEWPDHVVPLNSKKFDKFIDKYPLVVIDFWAAWCGPCKTLTPRFRQLSKMYKGKVAFGKVNVDSHRELSKRFHIMGIPNIFFFSYGEKIRNMNGVRNIDEYQREIDKILEKFDQ
jgi:thioredoxin 1